MAQKRCPACGMELPDDADRCPGCGLDGQNQIFLSEADYNAWVERVLRPYRESIRPPQVFAGPKHALILLANGDLYALGNNRNEACGPLPPDLPEPMRIARGVRHAAASPDHTLYVTVEGEAYLLGNSDLADRFDCPLRVRRVYARTDADAFWLVDETGASYFFGDRKSTRCVASSEQVLRTMPDVSVTIHKREQWYEYYESGTRRSGCYSYPQYSFCNFPAASMPTAVFRAEKVPQVEAWQKEEWYRALARRYGEKNISMEMGDPDCTEVLQERELQNGITKERESIQRWTYRPTVVLHNNRIYQPVPYEASAGKVGDCFNGCWPVTGEARELYAAELPPGVVKAMTGCFQDERYSTDLLAYLDGEGGFHFLKSSIFSKPLPVVPDVTDFAISPLGGPWDFILLVNRQREVLVCRKQEVLADRGWEHLRKLSFQEGNHGVFGGTGAGSP